MSKKIFLSPTLAMGKQVIKVDGKCYKRIGPTNTPPNTDSFAEVYESCEECEDDPIELKAPTTDP